VNDQWRYCEVEENLSQEYTIYQQCLLIRQNSMRNTLKPEIHPKIKNSISSSSSSS
jgi:hypothetical protein